MALPLRLNEPAPELKVIPARSVPEARSLLFVRLVPVNCSRSPGEGDVAAQLLTSLQLGMELLAESRPVQISVAVGPLHREQSNPRQNRRRHQCVIPIRPIPGRHGFLSARAGFLPPRHTS